jgi:hypothetical protein
MVVVLGSVLGSVPFPWFGGRFGAVCTWGIVESCRFHSEGSDPSRSCDGFGSLRVVLPDEDDGNGSEVPFRPCCFDLLVPK